MGNNIFHLIAFLTVAVWGTTFVFTKLLIVNGLSPAQIFTLRFIIAYVMLTAFSLLRPLFLRRKLQASQPDKWRKVQHRWLSSNWRDEMLMLALGVTGGSIYFLSENEALRFTTATNVSLIVCSCPLFAMLIIGMFYKSERFASRQMLGSLLALLGMAIVVLNGRFVLHLSPLGDTLAFGACLSWALYSLLMKPVMYRYSALFITRKVFFYGVLTILPYYLVVPGMPSLEVLLRPTVMANLFFLGCVASMLCYLTWSWCMARLGAVKCTNWVYLNPITTIVFAWLILDEQITSYFLIGAVFILLGMYILNKK
ncbi:MAG: DMT family transporter [Prevotellaceae bacterium]|nr:DMT family transporter [Prevotellaceae bacterium]